MDHARAAEGLGRGLALMFGRLQLYAIGVAAFVAGLFGIYLKGKSAGRDEVENEHNRRRIDAMRKAKDVRDEIMDDPYLVDRAQRWVRPDRDE